MTQADTKEVQAEIDEVRLKMLETDDPDVNEGLMKQYLALQRKKQALVFSADAQATGSKFSPDEVWWESLPRQNQAEILGAIMQKAVATANGALQGFAKAMLDFVAARKPLDAKSIAKIRSWNDRKVKIDDEEY